MAERDMTPDEMERFEQDALHQERERNRDLGPASEQDTPWSPEEPGATSTPIPNPD